MKEKLTISNIDVIVKIEISILDIIGIKSIS